MLIEYVNPETKCVLLQNGEVIEIVKLLDRRGEETERPGDAVACVAGPDDDGQWYSIPLWGMPLLH